MKINNELLNQIIVLTVVNAVEMAKGKRMSKNKLIKYIMKAIDLQLRQRNTFYEYNYVLNTVNATLDSYILKLCNKLN